MFGNGSKKDYRHVNLDDFSDDDDDLSAGDDHPYPPATSNGKKSNSSHRHHPPAAASHAHARAQELLAQQDAGLDFLGQSAERLNKLSLEISEELEGHNKILDDMDSDFDNANENLNAITRKTQEFIELSGGTKNLVIILTLSIICIILFFLILYT
jgi:hypothetical protein